MVPVMSSLQNKEFLSVIYDIFKGVISKPCVNTLLALTNQILRTGTCIISKLSKNVACDLNLGENGAARAARRIGYVLNHDNNQNILQVIIEIIMGFFDCDTRLTLAMDRTTWKMDNGTDINLLVIGIVLPNGVFFPIYWMPLEDKQHGNSNCQERMAAMQEFLAFWAATFIGGIFVGDREFIGLDWFNALLEMNLDFVIRIKHKDYRALIAEALGIRMDELDAIIAKALAQKGQFSIQFTYNGRKYLFIAKKNSVRNSDDDLYLLATLTSEEEALDIYRTRWHIERSFFNLKSNSFDMESLNLHNTISRSLMIACLLLNYVLSIIRGKEMVDNGHRVKKKKRKKDDSEPEYASKSIFLFGLEELVTETRNFIGYCNYLYSQMIRDPIKLSELGSIIWCV